MALPSPLPGFAAPLEPCPSDDVLAQIGGEGLSPEVRASVLRHAVRCPLCMTLLANLVSTSSSGERSAATAENLDAAPCVHPPALDQTRLRRGERVARYEITDILGEGSMGVVYAAQDPELHRPVALKLLRSVGGEATKSASAERARMMREAQTMAQLTHESAVAIYDIGTFKGQLFLVMELLRGGSLRERVQKRQREGRPLKVAEAVHIGQQIAAALCAAHQVGIVHRDLKPTNIMMALEDPESDRIKVVDFGLARWSALHQGSALASVAGGITTNGVFVGTPAYASPEQCRGVSAIDGQADVYSLGVMLYELLSRQLPFIGTPLQILALHLAEPPPPLREFAPHVPAALLQLVHDMLAKRPAERPTMAQVGQRLIGYAAPASLSSPLSARDWSWFRVGMGLLLVAAALGAYALRSRPAPVSLHGMTLIPGGTFLMGSTQEEIDAVFAQCAAIEKECPRNLFEREGPQHEVTLPAFYMDTVEVTNVRFAYWLNTQSASLEEGWDRKEEVGPEKERYIHDHGVTLIDLGWSAGGLMYAGGASVRVRPGFEDKPVTRVTWDGALRFCTAQGKRLPTEAEWEFAARGSVRRRYPWGESEPVCEQVVVERTAGLPCSRPEPGPTDVGTSPGDRTPEGVMDLGGNVQEWVQDVFQFPYRACASGCKSPVFEGSLTPGQVDMRVFRGGSWLEPGFAARGAGRGRGERAKAFNNTGFRCVSMAR